MSLQQVISIGTLEHKVEGILNDFELGLIDKSKAKSAFGDIILSWTETVTEKTLNYHLQTEAKALDETKSFDRIYLAATKSYKRETYHPKVSDCIDYLADYLRELAVKGSKAKQERSQELGELRLKFAAIRQVSRLLLTFEQYGIKEI